MAHPSASRPHAPRRQNSRYQTITRAPAKLQHSITHSLRRRGKPSQDFSPVNPLIKYILFFFNVICMLIGGALASMCIYVLVEKNKKVDSVIEFVFDPSCVFTVVGLVAFIVALFGLYGALRENICCLKFYHYSLSILLLLELLLIIFTLIYYYKEEALADIGLYPEDAFEEAIFKYRDDEDMQDFIDNIQEELECCGASNDDKGYLDWNSNRYFNCSDENVSPEKCSVPFSCCNVEKGETKNNRCGADMMKSETTGREEKIYTRGCLKALKQIITDNIWVVCGIVPGIFIPQMFLICFAKALISQIEEQMSKWY